jgi:hypothetical protein
MTRRSHHFLRLIVFSFAGLYVGSVAEAQSPGVSEVTSCGRTFLEIENQDAPDITWAGYGATFDIFWGLPAYSNGTNVQAACYQCTEAVHRFVRYMYGVESYYCGIPVMGNARYVARNLGKLLGDRIGSTKRITPYKVRMESFFNGDTGCRPVTGAVVSLEISFREAPCNAETGAGGACENYTKAKAYDSKRGAGHVAVIRNLTEGVNGVLEGQLFAQHGRMYSARASNRGAQISQGRIRFRRNEAGNWIGWWWTPKPDGALHTRPMPVVAWANPTIIARDATEADWKELPVDTACSAVPKEKSWGAGCEQIRAERRSKGD